MMQSDFTEARNIKAVQNFSNECMIISLIFKSFIYIICYFDNKNIRFTSVSIKKEGKNIFFHC